MTTGIAGIQKAYIGGGWTKPHDAKECPFKDAAQDNGIDAPYCTRCFQGEP